MYSHILPSPLPQKLPENLLRKFLVLVLSMYCSVLQAQVHQSTSRPEIKIDFSYAGYKGGGVKPPYVPAVLSVRPTGGDDTKLLQAAINHICSLPVQEDGFRGALQLGAGRFLVSGQLHVGGSGVVIRGHGNKTVLVATGIDRRCLIEIGGNDSSVLDRAMPVTDSVVPTGSRVLTVGDLNGLKAGDRVVITRPSTANWIADIGMNKAEGMFVAVRGLKWPTGSRDLKWDRIITKIDAANKQVILDAPITTALQQHYGGGTVQKVSSDRGVHSVGLEGLIIESAFNTNQPNDEEHAWMGIAINHATDVWVQDVTARHFVSAAVQVGQRARRVSILNCISEKPVSEIGGYRRVSFLVEGQQVLVRKCISDAGINAFASGFCAGGPNVFLDCKATNALGASGSFESWASGVLYENVTIEGAGLRLTYDEKRAQGGGWTAANAVVWNAKAKSIEVLGPPEEPNVMTNASYSLYQRQLSNRLGQEQTMVKNTQAGVSKTSAGVQEVSYQRVNAKGIREFSLKDIPADAAVVKPVVHPLQIVNGRFVMDNKIVWGGVTGDQYWRGQTFPGGELNSGVNITRYVPGKEGPGLTEDLPKLAQGLAAQGTRFYQSFTGLWYDRRRDDHSTQKREDANVWAPFYEMPWARSGKGKAWDGLSQYDLTKFNPWYFKRAKEFAQLCDEYGLVLYYNLYNTHNLLEYVTHWVDYPWRIYNTVNDTQIPEMTPMPWARIQMGNQFYDADNPNIRSLHRAYIFHVLDELGTAQNIIFNLGIQYSGPTSFQRFFLNTIGEWERQNNKNVRVVLNAAKNVTDSTLSDPQLAALVDVIDTRFWQYRPDGLFSNGDSLWAPKGGLNRSYREMVGEGFLQTTDYPLPTTQELEYKQVREYTDRYPDKAVVSVYNETSPIASLMAGGAQVLMGSQKDRGNGHLSLTSFVQQYLSGILMNMKPRDGLLEGGAQNWSLADPQNRSLLIYSLSGSTITLAKDISATGYEGVWYDPLSERVVPLGPVTGLKKGSVIQKPTHLNWLLLLRAK